MQPGTASEVLIIMIYVHWTFDAHGSHEDFPRRTVDPLANPSLNSLLIFCGSSARPGSIAPCFACGSYQATRVHYCAIVGEKASHFLWKSANLK